MKAKTKQDSNQNKKIKKGAKKESEDKKNQENTTINEEKDKKKKRTIVRMNKCEFCQNPIPDPKKTLNFSCQHQLCGVCISHCIFRDNFKCITERSDLITLRCNECLKRKSLEPGSAQVSISFILTVLKDTYKIRDKKQKDICLTHQLPAEYCKECKKWICEQCRKAFHDSNFPNHSAYATEEPFSFKKCPKHGDKGLELFCDDCGLDICASCALKGGEHGTHNVISLTELKRRIVNGKKKYKYQKFEEFDDMLQYMYNEFKNKYEESYKQKSDLISEITTLLQNYYDKFFSFKEKMNNFIENYFKIIRACYFNYFKDIEEKEPRINSIEFIDSVDKEISHFDFDSKYTKELENIKEELEKIAPKKFFEYKLRFLNHSFKCINSMKDCKFEVIKDKKHPKEKKIKEIMNQIYCLVQLKNGNVLTGGSQGVLTLWDIKADKKIETIKAHKGNIYSVIELEDGGFASSGSDSFINIWDIKNESDNNIEPKCIDIMPNIPLKKEINIMPIKNSEQNIIKIDNNIVNNKIINDNVTINKINNDSININNINNNINNDNINIKINNINNNINNDNNSINNINDINNVNEIHTTSFEPIKSNNASINLNTIPYNPFKLNEAPNTTTVPQNENNGFNSNPTINNINLGTTNQQIIKIDSNAADIGYGGKGVYNDLQKNVGYGSSGMSQNNNLNNQNNININSTMFPQNQGINTNQINTIINKDINNIDLNLNKDNANLGSMNETNKTENNINQGNSTNINQNINNDQNEMKISENNNINININNNSNNPTNTLDMNNNINNSNMNQINNNSNNNAKENNINNNSSTNQQQKPEEKKDEEESKYDDFFEDVKDSSIKPNPPKKQDELDSEKLNDEVNYICKFKLHGHSSDVNCIFETSQKKIISCGKDGYIIIWTLDEKEKPIKIFGHKNGVGCGIELKENTIITGGGDKHIKIWDLNINDMQKPDITLKGHTNAIFSICKINENKIASASCDKSIRIWDLNTNCCSQIFEGHSGFIWSLVNVEMNYDNKGGIKKLLASASSDKTIEFWDIDENRCYKTIVAHDREITTLGKLKDGNLISGSLDSTIKIWKL